MGLETATYISDLVATNPVGATDPKSQGDDHIRLVKSTVKATFANITGAVTATHTELNVLDGITASTAELNILDGVTATASELNILDGVTANAGEINVLDGITASTAELNILDGVTVTAADINTVTTRSLRAGDTYSGTHDFTGATLVAPAKSDKAGDTYSGNHNFTGAVITAPTQTAGDSTTKVATTAFVTATSFASTLPGQTGNARKFVTTDGTNASWSHIFGTPSLVSTPANAAAGGFYVLTASTTITLPATPAAGDPVYVVNRSGTTTPVIARNGSNIMGLAEDLTLDSVNASVTLVYADATRGWIFGG